MLGSRTQGIVGHRWKGILPLSSFPPIIVGIFLNIIALFVLTSIAPWTLIFEFVFFSI
jgi:hypothetical protein